MFASSLTGYHLYAKHTQTRTHAHRKNILHHLSTRTNEWIGLNDVWCWWLWCWFRWTFRSINITKLDIVYQFEHLVNVRLQIIVWKWYGIICTHFSCKHSVLSLSKICKSLSSKAPNLSSTHSYLRAFFYLDKDLRHFKWPLKFINTRCTVQQCDDSTGVELCLIFIVANTAQSDASQQEKMNQWTRKWEKGTKYHYLKRWMMMMMMSMKSNSIIDRYKAGAFFTLKSFD